MMNVTAASTNSTPVDTGAEETNAAQLTEAPKGLSILKARGQTVSQQDVSHFQQALTRLPGDSDEHAPAPEAFKDAATASHDGLPPAMLKTVLSSQQAGDEAVSAGNADTQPDAGDEAVSAGNAHANPEAMTSQMSARMRWMERRKFLETDKDNSANQAMSGGDAVVAPTPDQWLAQPKTEVSGKTTVVQMAATENAGLTSFPVGANPTQVGAEFQREDARDRNTDARDPAVSISAVPSVLSLSGNAGTVNPASEVVNTTVDTAWASRTVQDTVRTTLRTLAQRDLESLDAGRPVQITLDQGQLRGAQLTLQAQDGLLEVSVSTSQAQLRATLDAQQEVLAQGLLRDVGAVRWVGLQDALPSVSTNSDTSTSSASSQQNSQGNASDRQNQREAPVPDPDEVVGLEKPADRKQVIADAQSLRAFLGL